MEKEVKKYYYCVYILPRDRLRPGPEIRSAPVY